MSSSPEQLQSFPTQDQPGVTFYPILRIVLKALGVSLSEGRDEKLRILYFGTDYRLYLDRNYEIK